MPKQLVLTDGEKTYTATINRLGSGNYQVTINYNDGHGTIEWAPGTWDKAQERLKDFFGFGVFIMSLG